MARRQTAQDGATEKQAKFKELAIEKIIRRTDPLIATLLERISDEQWIDMAKKCRYNANKAINVLIANGITAMTVGKE